jgi:hypothetical protein
MAINLNLPINMQHRESELNESLSKSVDILDSASAVISISTNNSETSGNSSSNSKDKNPSLREKWLGVGVYYLFFICCADFSFRLFKSGNRKFREWL